MTAKPTISNVEELARKSWRSAARLAQPMDAHSAALLGAAAIAEAQSVSRLGLRLFQDRWTTAALGLTSFLSCRTAEDILAAQASMVCEDLDLIRGGCERLSEIIAQGAGEAVRSMPADAPRDSAPLA